MLTFEFTGVEGRMAGSEILTSGMVGKTVQIRFDDSWTNLSKTVVFRAGNICATAPGDTFPIAIPSEVLRHPFRKLHVGVYGTDEAGTLVIPTVMVEGPMIRYGADPNDPVTPEATLSHITAVYTGGSVPVGTDVYSLSGLTVTAHYYDGTSAAITGYTIGGQIAVAGTNTLSIGYEGKFTTVSVTGEETKITLIRITANYTGGSVPVGTDINSLVPNLTVIAQFSDGSTNRVVGYGLSGTISSVGANVITVIYGGLTATFTVTGETVPSEAFDMTAH